jgi:hypothetical protein
MGIVHGAVRVVFRAADASTAAAVRLGLLRLTASSAASKDSRQGSEPD